MTIDETILSIAATLRELPDWEERYAAIISMGKGLAPYPEEYRADQFIVSGCQSRVWLHPRLENGIVVFDADSDAVIVKGLVAILMKVYSNRTPAEIMTAPSDLAQRLHLEQHLSVSRVNGLASMVKQIRLYALALSLKTS